jgi:hypothetical protein
MAGGISGGSRVPLSVPCPRYTGTHDALSPRLVAAAVACTAHVHALCHPHRGPAAVRPYEPGRPCGRRPARRGRQPGCVAGGAASVTPQARPVFLQQVHGTQVVVLGRHRRWRGGRCLREHAAWAGLHDHGGRLPARAADRRCGYRGGGCTCGLARAGGAGRCGGAGGGF